MLFLVALLATSDTSSYWQQQVAYRITASLDEPSGVLTGRERITYVNRSPDVLRDFYVHDYLNAFRPGSRWSAVDSVEGRVRFQHLAEPDFAFERITAASLMGVELRPDFPYAPDSTIAHWTLPRSLAPGDSLVVEIEWQARPSTLPRRQGRRGRRFDFAQWYPKVVVYDRHGWEDHPLYPAGEFYGEFATYDVTLDLPEDQVIGATGVPVCGDPGWERARAIPGSAIDYQRGAYGAVPDECPAAAAGRKTVRFRAEQVHHFAFSLNPEYHYEEGRYGAVVVRVLYQPQDTATWGHGIAVQRTETALAWLDSLYGPFAWPQLTNVHRIEGGGTEFPMMVMDGGPSLGLILHEVGHNYTMGVLANNEWREGFLDEGFTSFQTSWYAETHGGESEYPGLEANILFDDLDRWSEPVSMISENYRDFFLYNEMIYDKGQLFYEQLRYVVGDETMRRILRTYYARWKLKHVDEEAFRDVCEEVSGQDLGWLFGAWLHGTPLIDYELQKVERHRLANGRWQVVVTIKRLGDGWMPIEIGDRTHLYARSTGQPEVERVAFTTDSAPGRLMLDPRGRAHDWNMLNNARAPRPVPEPPPSRTMRLDNPTHDVVRRDRLDDRTDAGRVVQRCGRRHRRAAQPVELPRPLRAGTGAHHPRPRSRRYPTRRRVPAVGESGGASRAPHHQRHGGLGRGRPGRRPLVLGSGVAATLGGPGRSPCRIRRPVDGHDGCELSRSRAMGGRRHRRSRSLDRFDLAPRPRQTARPDRQSRGDRVPAPRTGHSVDQPLRRRGLLAHHGGARRAPPSRHQYDIGRAAVRRRLRGANQSATPAAHRHFGCRPLRNVHQSSAPQPRGAVGAAGLSLSGARRCQPAGVCSRVGRALGGEHEPRADPARVGTAERRAAERGRDGVRGWGCGRQSGRAVDRWEGLDAIVRRRPGAGHDADGGRPRLDDAARAAAPGEPLGLRRRSRAAGTPA